MVCREFPTASSNKVGTKLGEGAVILSPTRIVKIQNKSDHYALLPPYLSLFPPMSPLTILQIPLFLPLPVPVARFQWPPPLALPIHADLYRYFPTLFEF